jgi:C4-dicarboxylate transporter DctM subunit
MNEPITEVARISYASLNTYALICLPLFMLGGQLLQQAKTADRLFRMANKWIGHLPGGLAVATIAACAVFSAVSGSSVATAATMGVISIPSMLSLGYPKRIVYGATAGGGLLGIMIPPSSAMIVYSSITDESIADLFIAGVVPGIILAMLFAIYVYIRSCKRVEIARQEKATWKERFMSLKGASGVIGAVLLVFGGIYGGIFTPIEASAVFVAYILIIAFASGDITLKTAKEAIAESTEGVIMIMVIIAGAVLLGHIITLSGLPTRVGDFIVGHKLSAFTVLSIIMFTWMVMGLFMDGLAIQLISLPIFYPVIKTLGVDGIWFGILLVVTIEMALITPPVGLNIYVIQGLTKAPASEVIKSVMPYFFILCIMVVMLYIWPELATWLPSTMKK